MLTPSCIFKPLLWLRFQLPLILYCTETCLYVCRSGLHMGQAHFEETIRALEQYMEVATSPLSNLHAFMLTCLHMDYSR